MIFCYTILQVVRGTMMQSDSNPPIRLFVTISRRAFRDKVLLELPGREPISAFLPDLPLAMDWKELKQIPAQELGLETEDGVPLPSHQTLPACGISNSDLLYIVHRVDAEPNRLALPAESPIPQAADKSLNTHSLSIKHRQLLSQPHFRTGEGVLLLLGDPPITIGRGSTSERSNLNLSSLDPKVIASRKHALLEKQGPAFCLTAYPTTNGTFLNEEEIPPGIQHALRSGDRIQFGFQGVKVIFCNPCDAPE
jgi:hypothetical protein